MPPFRDMNCSDPKHVTALVVDAGENLSVPICTLTNMNNMQKTPVPPRGTETDDPFADPVGYLALYGIEAEIVFVEELPVAA